MSATGTLAGPHRGLLEWLAANGVEHQLREHPLTFTARETARVEGLDPRRFAKTLGIGIRDDRRAMVVLDAIDHLDLARARRFLEADVRLLGEPELLELCPDCEVGAMPPVGALWNLPVYADFAIRDAPEITFHAGSHRYTVAVERATWERAAGVRYGDLAVKVVGAPPWDRS